MRRSTRPFGVWRKTCWTQYSCFVTIPWPVISTHCSDQPYLPLTERRTPLLFCTRAICDLKTICGSSRLGSPFPTCLNWMGGTTGPFSEMRFLSSCSLSRNQINSWYRPSRRPATNLVTDTGLPSIRWSRAYRLKWLISVGCGILKTGRQSCRRSSWSRNRASIFTNIASRFPTKSTLNPMVLNNPYPTSLMTSREATSPYSSRVRLLLTTPMRTTSSGWWVRPSNPSSTQNALSPW